jgi:hypothetical protein
MTVVFGMLEYVFMPTTHAKARDQVNFVDVDGNHILQRRC